MQRRFGCGRGGTSVRCSGVAPGGRGKGFSGSGAPVHPKGLAAVLEQMIDRQRRIASCIARFARQLGSQQLDPGAAAVGEPRPDGPPRTRAGPHQRAPVPLYPLLDEQHFLGAMYDPIEGHVDPYGVTHAYAKSAQIAGAEVVRQNRVLDTKQRPDGTWDVITEKGTVHAEHVVNAGGLWAREVGRFVGLELPRPWQGRRALRREEGGSIHAPRALEDEHDVLVTRNHPRGRRRARAAATCPR